MRRFRTLVGFVILGGIGGAGCLGDAGQRTIVFSTTTVAGSSDSGAVDGPIANARFNNPVNAVVATDGTVYVCDFDNGRVRQIRGGQVSTLVNQTNFQRPFGIALASDGTLYVQTDTNDTGSNNASTGTVWQVNRTTGVATRIAADLGRPRGIAVLADGRIAMSNLTRHTIQILNPTTGTVTDLAGESGTAGFANGTGTAARFNRPYGLTVLANGDLLVADQDNNRLRRVTLAGVVTTFAGTGAVGAGNGSRLSATFNGPQDVDFNPLDGAIYVADTRGKLIRKIDGDTVTTIAGDGTAGYQEGIGSSARFFGMEGMGLDLNANTLVVADGNGGEPEPFNRVRRIQL